MEFIYVFIGLMVWLYFVGLIAFGILQPLKAVCELLGVKRYSSKYAIGLKRYLTAVVGYFAFLHLMIKYGDLFGGLFDFIGFYVTILPLAFVIWNIRFYRKWDRQMKNIQEYDRMKILEAPHPDRLLLDSFPKKKMKLKSPIKASRKIKANEAVVLALPILNKAK